MHTSTGLKTNVLMSADARHHFDNARMACAAGKWVMVDGPELKWTEGDRWRATVSLPAGSIHEYKYVLLDSTGVHAQNWQRGNNSVLAIQQVQVNIC